MVRCSRRRRAAKAITGYQVNGYDFWSLAKPKTTVKKARSVKKLKAVRGASLRRRLLESSEGRLVKASGWSRFEAWPLAARP